MLSTWIERGNTKKNATAANTSCATSYTEQWQKRKHPWNQIN
jgi:hypothetical protein